MNFKHLPVLNLIILTMGVSLFITPAIIYQFVEPCSLKVSQELNSQLQEKKTASYRNT